MIIKVKEQKKVFQPYTIEITVGIIEQHESLRAMASTSDSIPAEAAKFYAPFAKHTSSQEIEHHIKEFLNSLRGKLPNAQVKAD